MAAVIPARNEADVIVPVVRALLAQRDFAMPVYLVDDGSTDGTADAARSAAATLDEKGRLTVAVGAVASRRDGLENYGRFIKV